MGRTCRQEKHSPRTVRPKTLRAKSYKKRRRETREDFSRKRKLHAFRGISALENDDARPEEQRAMFVNSPRTIRGKTSPDGRQRFFLRDSDSECSAYLSVLLTYIVLPCIPSPLDSRCQLAPPAPSPLATELLYAAAATARSSCRRYSTPTRPTSPPPSPARAPGFARPQVRTLPLPPLYFSLSPATHARAATAIRGPCPECPAPGTSYVAAAAALVAALIPRPSRHQLLPPDALPGTSTPH
jgi:hypothetical protein